MRYSKFKVLIPETKLKRKYPVNLKPQDLNLFRNDIEKVLPEVSLLKFEDSNVTAESIVWRHFSIANELLIYPHHTEMYYWRYTISNMLKRKRQVLLPGKYFLCTDYWADGYFHWMCDSLPRIFLVRDQLKDGTLLLPEQYTLPYYKETLQAFEIKEIRRIPIKTYFHFSELYSPGQPTVSGEHNPLLTRMLREHLLHHYSKSFTGVLNFPNIYISRNKAKYRKVLNEDEIITVLKKYGFKVIFFEDYCMNEQVEIAFNARNVISLHGANLTNTLFMKPGGNVLEFRKTNDAMNNYYYSLVDSVDCNYYYQNCEHIDRRVGNFFDVIVNAEELDSNLKQMTGAL
jgi:capsular polysaccharide biosynthesis protein